MRCQAGGYGRDRERASFGAGDGRSLAILPATPLVKVLLRSGVFLFSFPSVISFVLLVTLYNLAFSSVIIRIQVERIGPGEGLPDDEKTTKSIDTGFYTGGKRESHVCGLYHWGKRTDLAGIDLAHLINDLSCCYTVELVLVSCF